MSFGIDDISFYTPRYYLDLKHFANARGQEVEKFHDDLGQKKMSVVPPNEDVITMAASAALPILKNIDHEDIEMVLFATETGVDLSKAAATYVHKMFNLPKRCRVIELKQACYSATFGLQMALSWLHQNPNKKVLLLASDIARYEFNTAAESSQGAGAVAMLLSANPKLLEVGLKSGFCTREAMDFWRPNYSDYAMVDGRLSCDVYLKLAEETWLQYLELNNCKFEDHDRFCYHVPLAKLAESAHKKIARISGFKKLTGDQLDYQIRQSLIYNKEVGNCYTASLYLSIISLLENAPEDLSGKLIGLYSYGSGSVAEFFSARVVSGYKNNLRKKLHQDLLNSRKSLSFEEYEIFYNDKLPEDGGDFRLPSWDSGYFSLKSIVNHQRVYERSK